MAKPRIFISSTYYDLKQTREDIANFLLSLGYEPIRNEEGSIAYGSEKELQDYCYKEIHTVDILISIIGGRFGSEANDKQWSVSNKELLTALEDEKQVYIFIDKNVAAEYRTYMKNRDKDIDYCYVDNLKIYEFIEKINNLRRNNNIKTFETSADILFYLKEQLAGLFHSLLEEKERNREINLANKLIASTKSLEDLVQLLINANKNSADDVKKLIKTNHPAVKRISELLGFKFGIWFDSLDMLSELLSNCGWSYLTNNDSGSGVLEWKKERFLENSLLLQVSTKIFNEDRVLHDFTQKDWDDNYINIFEQKESSDINLPF